MDLTGARLRLLFLVPFTPRLAGHHGGARVTGQLIANLAARHDVALVHLAKPGEPPVDDELARRCARVEPVTQTRPASRLRTKLALLRATPTWVSEVTDRGFAARVREVAARFEPQIVQLEYPVMGRYLSALEGCPAPRVMTDHEGSVRDLREWRGPFAAVTGALDERAWRSFERRVIERIDVAVVFTERDRRALAALGARTPIAVVPFGIPIPPRPLAPGGTDPPSVLFVGSFAHPANGDAAAWLAGTIFPAVRARCPRARLTIVGADPPPHVLALAGGAVDVAGEVADVTPYLDAAAVVAAPIRIGGGMRVKVLEALAAGKALVATPLAVEGLELGAADQLEIAGDEGAFVRALVRLLSDEEARHTLATHARAWAVERLGWEPAVARYEELYDALLADGSRS